jgi:hypothetical protein
LENLDLKLLTFQGKDQLDDETFSEIPSPDVSPKVLKAQEEQYNYENVSSKKKLSTRDIYLIVDSGFMDTYEPILNTKSLRSL